MMVDWPDYEIERLSGVLLRVDLQERRHQQNGAWPSLVDHLVRAVSAACLSHREAEADAYLRRAAKRMEEWIREVEAGLSATTYNMDFATARGLFALILVNGPDTELLVDLFLRQSNRLPSGPVHNARLIGLLLLKRYGEIAAAASFSSLEDAGLGAPWKRFAMALPGAETTVMQASLERWLNEKMESTQTHEWGAYNEVPIEVSGALALAERCGVPVKVDSNRVLPKFRR